MILFGEILEESITLSRRSESQLHRDSITEGLGAEPRNAVPWEAVQTDKTVYKTVEGSTCLNAALNREMKLLPYMVRCFSNYKPNLGISGVALDVSLEEI